MLDHLLTSRLPPTAAARARLRHGPRTTVWFAAASLVALLAVFGVANRVSRPRKPSGTSVVNYQLVSPQGGTYHISVQGQAELLSIEVNGTIAHFDKETLP
jgi:hypothetical protein